MDKATIQHIAVQTLKKLISLPSVSGDEEKAADCIREILEKNGFRVKRKFNNVWAALNHSEKLPTLLLNSHLDTVQPVEGWTTDPYQPVDDGIKITGLGSNDAGASLVSLLAVFILLSHGKELPFNLMYLASAEEEISGKHGVESVLDELGQVHLGIVGEPTRMKLAVAEKGLLVLDCTTHGVSGHAARNNGINAIYQAMHDIEWIKNYRFIKKSKLTGEITMQVTQINGGVKHNIIPGKCSFVVDIRTNDQYTHNEILTIIREHLASEVTCRSTRLKSSAISPGHPIVRAAEQINLECYGSDTLSDQALMPFPTVKIGPGCPLRSHTADEYILAEEIYQGIDRYLELLNTYAELLVHERINENVG